VPDHDAPPDHDTALHGAVHELYTGEPDEFMRRRGELSAAAKQAGAGAAAKQIAALRKPTRSAYTVNRLTRAEPDRIGELVELGGQLRLAERSVDAVQIRELTRRRRRLLDELTRLAFDIVEEPNPSSALRDEVVSTLTAALADEDIAAQVSAGTLVKPARWEGFGLGGSRDLTLVPSLPAPRPPAARPPASGAAARRGLSKAEREEAERRAEAAATEETARVKAAAEEAKRGALEDARRAVDEAEEAVLLATDEEQVRMDRLRELEEQVTDARRSVDEARVHLRRAEIKQRRVTDALRRLGG
jgi:hypothetical protein